MSGRAERCLTCVGDAGSIDAWSGIPYHLFQAGRQMGFFSVALALQPERMKLRRLLWNLASPLRIERPGGYQYVDSFLSRLYAQIPAEHRGKEIVSQFQLFPPVHCVRADGAVFSFYIDMPLRRLFEDYGVGRRIGRRSARKAVEREKEGYDAAERVVTMSPWATASVVEEYGIPARKVHHVVPGANLPEDAVQRFTNGLDDAPVEAEFGPSRPFRLGFTGKDYVRKGLPRLVQAAEALHRRGHSVRVIVLGHCSRTYEGHPLVEAVGFLNKATDIDRFLRIVSSYDLGCLPSHAEALGISTLECLRLGVPVLGTSVGGIPQCVPEGAGLLVPGDATPADIADAVEPLLSNPDLYASMRRQARRRRWQFTWAHTVKRLQAVWAGAAD